MKYQKLATSEIDAPYTFRVILLLQLFSVIFFSRG